VTEHSNCKTCKCEPQFTRDEFTLQGVNEKDLATFVGVTVAGYFREAIASGKNPYKIDMQLRFEYDPRYLRDKLVIVRKNH